MELPDPRDSGLRVPPAPQRVFNIKVPAFADLFRFEWHPDRGAVYVVRLGITPEFGDPIADQGMVKDHGTAINVVNVWLRGYKAHTMEVDFGRQTAAQRQREALGLRSGQGAGPAFERRDLKGGAAASAPPG